MLNLKICNYQQKHSLNPSFNLNIFNNSKDEMNSIEIIQSEA